MKLKLLSIAVSSCLASSLFSLTAYAACSDGDFAQCRTQQECEDQKGSWTNNQCSAFGQIPTSSTAQTTSSTGTTTSNSVPETIKLMVYLPTNGKITGYVGNQIVNCGGGNNDCQINAPINTPVNLNAEANTSYSFKEWVNGCPIPSISSNCGFNLTKYTEIGVNFISQYPSSTTTQPPVQNTTDLTTGLMAYYCFDDPSNIAKDCSNNNNTGLASNVSTIANGVKGGAANFGGFTNVGSIRVPNSTSLSLDRYLTASFFVKLNSEGGMDGYGNLSSVGVHNIFSKDHDSSGFYSSLAVPNGTVGAWFGNSQPNFGISGNKTYSILQNWLHVAYVFSKDTGTAQMYFNGELVKEETGKSIDFSIANARDLYIGKYRDRWYPLNGMLDEVRFYNRALSASEIKQLATVANQTNFSLTVDKPSNGEVVATNIACGSDCTESYPEHTLVNLMAKPAQGFIVDNWTGCTPSADKQTCEVVMNTAKSISVSFKASSVIIPPPPFTECDPVYNFQTESISFYVSFPTTNVLNNGLTGDLAIFKATLNRIYNTGEPRFYVMDFVPELPKPECQGQVAILTNDFSKVHLPRVAVPEITKVLGKTVQTGVSLYQVTLDWYATDNNLGISSISPL